MDFIGSPMGGIIALRSFIIVSAWSFRILTLLRVTLGAFGIIHFPVEYLQIHFSCLYMFRDED